MSDPISSDGIAAVRAALIAEFEAAYGYGAVGAHLAGAARARALSALAWHQHHQIALSAQLVAASAPLPAADPAYTLPFPLSSAAAARRLAAELEDSVAAHCADLVAVLDGSSRLAAAAALGECAVRAALWRDGTTPFPGLPERA